MRGNLIPQRCGFYQKRIKKNFIFRLCHVKATACHEESTPKAAKHAVPVFTCVCVCMLVFPHLHVACRIQKVMPGFPSHFPFRVLKQGLLLNPKLVESSNLTPQLPEDSRLTSQALGLQVASMALKWVLRKRTLVLVFAGQELRPLNHPLTNSHAAILVWENRLLYMVCPLMEIKTSYSHARQELPPPSGTRSPKVLSKSGKLMRSIMVYRYDNTIIKPNTMLT